jgi:hypothetical protein
MSSRERKRASRRKRKQRATAPPDGEPATTEPAVATEEEPVSVEDIAAEAEAGRVSRSEARNAEARAQLEPLAPGERPTVVTIGALVSAAIAASILIGWLAGAKVDVSGSELDERPRFLSQVLPPAILFSIMAWGMWRARYWAVLGFEAIMAIIMIGAGLTLVAATSVFKALSAVLVLAAAGALFWFTVKALARIQMPTPADRRPH